MGKTETKRDRDQRKTKTDRSSSKHTGTTWKTVKKMNTDRDKERKTEIT